MNESNHPNVDQRRHREDHVRIRAYLIWEREGRPDGEQLEHWRRAEHELASPTMTQNLEESSFEKMGPSDASG
jgi:hypothetical protein